MTWLVFPENFHKFKLNYYNNYICDGNCTCSPDILSLEDLEKLTIRQFIIIPAVTVQTDKPWMDSRKKEY